MRTRTLDGASGPLASLWWLLALRGVAGLLLALLAIVWPLLTLEALLYGFAFYVAVDGVFAIASGLGRSAGGAQWPFIVEGACGLALAVAILALPGTMAFVLWYLIAGWALATGLAELLAALPLYRAGSGGGLLATAGVVSTLFGVAMVVWPRSAMIGLSWLIGLYAALFGVVLLSLAVRLYGITHAPRPPLTA